jgi:hypothetical protein
MDRRQQGTALPVFASPGIKSKIVTSKYIIFCRK